MKLPELKLLRRLSNETRHLHPYLMTYETEAGVKTYEMVSQNPDLHKHSLPVPCGTVMIVLGPDKSRLLLCREFRMAVNKTIYNLPSGFSEPGETPEQTAARELKEETGLDLLQVLCTLPPSFIAPPVTDMSVHTVICTAKGALNPEQNPNEVIQPRWFTREELKQELENPNLWFSARALDAAVMFLNLLAT